jgi:hypothetical protein
MVTAAGGASLASKLTDHGIRRFCFAKDFEGPMCRPTVLEKSMSQESLGCNQSLEAFLSLNLCLEGRTDGDAVSIVAGLLASSWQGCSQKDSRFVAHGRPAFAS